MTSIPINSLLHIISIKLFDSYSYVWFTPIWFILSSVPSIVIQQAGAAVPLVLEADGQVYSAGGLVFRDGTTGTFASGWRPAPFTDSASASASLFSSTASSSAVAVEVEAWVKDFQESQLRHVRDVDFGGWGCFLVRRKLFTHPATATSTTNNHRHHDGGDDTNRIPQPSSSSSSSSSFSSSWSSSSLPSTEMPVWPC